MSEKEKTKAIAACNNLEELQTILRIYEPFFDRIGQSTAAWYSTNIQDEINLIIAGTRNIVALPVVNGIRTKVASLLKQQAVTLNLPSYNMEESQLHLAKLCVKENPGATFAKIAKLLCISERTLYRMNKKHNFINSDNRDEIKYLKSVLEKNGISY